MIVKASVDERLHPLRPALTCGDLKLQNHRKTLKPEPPKTKSMCVRSMKILNHGACTGEIKSVRRDERGQERCMVEFIGFSNSREFKAGITHA